MTGTHRNAGMSSEGLSMGSLRLWACHLFPWFQRLFLCLFCVIWEPKQTLIKAMDPQLTGISSHCETKGLSAHFKDGEQLMSSKLSGQVRARVQSADPDLTMQAGCCGDGVSVFTEYSCQVWGEHGCSCVFSPWPPLYSGLLTFHAALSCTLHFCHKSWTLAK